MSYSVFPFLQSEKFSKLRLTGLATSNATGKKLPMFVIVTNANPWCFKHIRSFPCKYKSQGKNWMDNEIFTSWVTRLDRIMIAEGRRIVLIMDNLASYIEEVEAVE